MTRILIVLCALLFIADKPAYPASPWLRRIALAAGCALSATDILSTKYAVARGAHESNGLFADHGRPLYGRMVGAKAGICMAPVIWGEFNRKPHVDQFLTGVGFTMGAGFGWATWHNYRLGARLEEKRRLD